MDLFVIISLLLGLVSLIVAFILEGGHLSSLLEPTAALIVFGGTFGAVGVSFPAKILAKVPKLIKILLTNKKEDRENLILQFKDLSNKVRKDGLLALDSELQTGEYDKFLIHGLQLVTDGIDGDLIRKTLETRIDNMEYRHSKGIAIFEAAGGFAPTMGVIGTVMGLVHVLSNLSDPSTLGPKIAVAFIATLYGVGSANLIWLPIANRLKELDSDEILTKSMIVEGIMMIYSGSNPALIEERLRGFLEHEEETGEKAEQ